MRRSDSRLSAGLPATRIIFTSFSVPWNRKRRNSVLRREKKTLRISGRTTVLSFSLRLRGMRKTAVNSSSIPPEAVPTTVSAPVIPIGNGMAARSLKYTSNQVNTGIWKSVSRAGIRECFPAIRSWRMSAVTVWLTGKRILMTHGARLSREAIARFPPTANCFFRRRRITI